MLRAEARETPRHCMLKTTSGVLDSASRGTFTGKFTTEVDPTEKTEMVTIPKTILSGETLKEYSGSTSMEDAKPEMDIRANVKSVTSSDEGRVH